MKIIGHRGAAGLAPENTLAAIEAGIKAGADQLEVDVRVTSDDIPIVSHDRRINGALVFLHTFAELKAQKPELLTLEEAIRAVKHRVPIKIDVKPDDPAEALVIAELLQKLLRQGWKSQDFLLASFSQRALLALHKALPDLDVQVIERWSGIRATWRARQLQTKYICMNHHFLWWGFIRHMFKRGYKLSVYTLNNPRKARGWESYGLWGVDTDYPDRFKK